MKKILAGLLFSLLSSSLIIAQSPEIVNKKDEVDINLMMNLVKDLSGENYIEVNDDTLKILSRHYTQPGNQYAADYIFSILKSYGYQVDVASFSATGKNIIATLPGRLYPNRYVIVGAHYDSAPNGELAPGADDNASGVAAVLEMARLLQEVELPYTVVFALWDEEEIGLYGSRAYAMSFGGNDEELIAYINLDMIGWDGNDDGIVEINTRNVAQSAPLAEKISQWNVDYGIGLQPVIINPGPNASDFYSFWVFDYTSVGINEVYYDVDNNPYWHTIEDKADKINETYFLKCAQLALVTLLETAYDTSQVVSVKDRLVKNDVFLYPNPFDKEILLKSPILQQSDVTVSLWDLQGKNYEINWDGELQKITLQEQLSSGIYLIKLDMPEGTITQKVIKL